MANCQPELLPRYFIAAFPTSLSKSQPLNPFFWTRESEVKGLSPWPGFSEFDPVA